MACNVVLQGEALLALEIKVVLVDEWEFGPHGSYAACWKGDGPVQAEARDKLPHSPGGAGQLPRILRRRVWIWR